MAETIKDFFVSLGWEIDEQKQKKFVDSMRTAELQAKLLADALEAMARKAAEAVAGVAASFDALYFSSQRTGATAATIRDMGYAVAQLGGSAEQAQASLESMAQKLRENPGNIYYLNSLGLSYDKTTGKLKDNVELLKQFQQMNISLAEKMREGGGMDEKTFLARRDPRYLQYVEEAEVARKRMNFDPDQAAKDANDFMTTWRRVSNDLGVIADSLFTKLMKALDEPLRHFTKFVEDHSPEIKTAIENIAVAVADLADKFDKWFEGIDWKKVDAEFQTFGSVLNGLTGHVGGLTTAFETFFALWTGSQFVAVLANMKILLGTLGPIASIVGGAGAVVGGLMNYGDASGNAGMGSVIGNGGNLSADQIQKDYNSQPKPESWGAWFKRKLGFGGGSATAGGANGIMAPVTGADAPRNLRNNNPGNINDGPWARRQPGYVGSDGRFARFSTMEDGYRAANANLDNYAGKGWQTPADIVSHWAPSGDGANDPAGYAAKLQRLTGLDPNAPLGSDPASRAKMLRGMTGIEGSRMPYSVDQIAAALGGAALPSAGIPVKPAPQTARSVNLPGLSAADEGKFPDWMDERSRRELGQVNSELAQNLLDASRLTGIRFSVTQGMRSQADAAANALKGTGVYDSQHLYGAAVDLHVDGGRYAQLGRAFEALARARGQPGRWLGGVAGPWSRDFVHYDEGIGYGQHHARHPFASTPPLGGDGGAGVSVNSTNHFHIDGANDPSIVAHMVASHQKRIADDMTLNMIGAVN